MEVKCVFKVLERECELLPQMFPVLAGISGYSRINTWERQEQAARRHRRTDDLARTAFTSSSMSRNSRCRRQRQRIRTMTAVHDAPKDTFSKDEEARLQHVFDLLHLFYHRSKNQHRRSVWWRHFCIFRKQLDTLLTDVRLLNQYQQRTWPARRRRLTIPRYALGFSNGCVSGKAF